MTKFRDLYITVRAKINTDGVSYEIESMVKVALQKLGCDIVNVVVEE